MKYHLYKAINGEWRWYLVSPNGRKIADSGEGYKRRKDCTAAIGLVKASTAAQVHQK